MDYFKPFPGTQVPGYSHWILLGTAFFAYSRGSDIGARPDARPPDRYRFAVNISESLPGTVVRFPIADYPKSEPADRIRQFCRR